MPNNYLSVLYKHIIKVENKNVGLKVCVWGGGAQTIAHQSKKWGGAHASLTPPPLPTPMIHTYMHTYIYIYIILRLHLEIKPTKYLASHLFSFA